MATNSWRVAKSLDKLRKQVNALAPGRSKASDGTIGDLRHAATKSDHNPLDHDHNPNTAGVVLALDLTHDPAGGCDAGKIADSLVGSRDDRIAYIIWNKRIISPTVSPWKWRMYSGSNPHTKHVHVSVVHDERRFDDERPWAVQVGPLVTQERPTEPVRPPPDIPAPTQPTAPKPARSGLLSRLRAFFRLPT